MFYASWHNLIVVYRIEDKNGNSPFYVSSVKNHFPQNVYPDYGNYRYGYCNPNTFLEPEYYAFYNDDKYDLFEYLLYPKTISVSSTGVVSFRPQSVISKTKLMKGLISWQIE